MTCKTCETKYHCCSSCDILGDEYLVDGWCSEECYKKSDRFKRVLEVTNKLRAGEAMTKNEIDFLLYDIQDYEKYMLEDSNV